jgi:hypothetical protein
MIARKSRCICRAAHGGQSWEKPGMFRCITPGINLLSEPTACEKRDSASSALSVRQFMLFRFQVPRSFGHQLARYSKGYRVSPQDQNNAPSLGNKISHRHKNMGKPHRRKHPKGADRVRNWWPDYALVHLKPRRVTHAVIPCFPLTAAESFPDSLGMSSISLVAILP